MCFANIHETIRGTDAERIVVKVGRARTDALLWLR